MPAPSLAAFELTVILSVARLGEEAYGLSIRRDVSARTKHDYSVGAIYTTLQRLEDKGFLDARMSEPLPIRGGRARRHFTLTTTGKRAIRDAERLAASLWAGVATLPQPRTS